MHYLLIAARKGTNFSVIVLFFHFVLLWMLHLLTMVMNSVLFHIVQVFFLVVF